MQVAVVGCGAIGGVIAATLSRDAERTGVGVLPITGSAEIAAGIASEGLRVREIDGSSWVARPSRAPIVHASDAGEALRGRIDLCIVATKLTQLEDALSATLPYLAPDALVVCCQNGLPEAHAARIVGAGRVVGCVVGWGASMLAPGSYVRTSRGKLQLGASSRQAAARLGDLARVLEAASPVEMPDDFEAARWSKLAINCATSTIGAVGGKPLGALLRHRAVRRLALEVFAEVLEVARRSGVEPTPIGGLDLDQVAITPEERALRFGSPSLALKHSLLLAVGVKYRRMRSSMLYALERGRTPEIDFLNGEIVRRARALGMAAPVNEALVDAVRGIQHKRLVSSPDTLFALHDALVADKQALAA